jgi:alkanesulfonate monooxygenase SsuD/methylene tetrahydromethanopterin reductase-like flavin-dependent oxidoreductase (luciferase family)
MAAATLQDLSGGRAILGLGSGSPTGTPGDPGRLERTRRFVQTVQAILAGQEAESDALLGMPAFRLELWTPTPVPIWVAALGDGMVRLAGLLADGTLLNWCTPERVHSATTLIRESAERAGRDPREVTIAVYVRACLGLDEDVAVLALKEMAGRYSAIPHYRRQFEAMGLGEEAAVAAAAFEARRPSEVPEALVRATAVTGGRREALQRFAAYREAGADVVLCYPVSALDGFSSVLGSVLGAAPNATLGSASARQPGGQ